MTHESQIAPTPERSRRNVTSIASFAMSAAALVVASATAVVVLAPSMLAAPAPAGPPTVAQQNAIRSAQQHLEVGSLPLSRKDLVAELEFEGFSSGDAEYAVDHAGTDFNAEAAQAAALWLAYRDPLNPALVDYLKNHGFTSEQIRYGLDQVGR